MRARLFAHLSLLTLVTSMLAACGGSKPEDPKTPAGEPAPGDGSGSAAPAAVDAGPPTTTTSTLSHSGDLQGAKLTTSSSTTLETKGTSGPTPGGEGEPGRRREDIQTIIGARREDARKCYDDAVKRNPSLEGDLDIKWTIDPKGNVTDIGVDASKSQIQDEALGKCVIAIIQKVKFAESPKGFESRMHYPFNFHPKASQRAPGPKK